MDKRKIIGISITVVLAALLILSIAMISKVGKNGATATGAATTGTTGSYDGFDSYEEMMAAHHGGSGGSSGGSGSTGVGGCGAEPVANAGSHDSISTAKGEMSEYGISYDTDGYNVLLGYAKSVKLSSAQMAKVVGLDVALPCCGFATLQASGNCECGHHVAMFGLAKYLTSKDYPQGYIQRELDKWKKVFYPEGSAGAGAC